MYAYERRHQANLVERIEDLQFSIEGEMDSILDGIRTDKACYRLRDLQRRDDLINRYAVRHLGSIVISD